MGGTAQQHQCQTFPKVLGKKPTKHGGAGSPSTFYEVFSLRKVDDFLPELGLGSIFA